MGENLSNDPLLRCLVILTKLNQKPTSEKALTHGLPFKPGIDKQRLFSLDNPKANFSRAAEKAGFSSQLLKRKLDEIPSLVLPVILTLKNDHACVLVEIDHADKIAQVIIPSIDETPVEISFKNIEDDYLERINSGYLEFLKNQTDIKVKIIDISDIDFIKNRADYLWLLNQICEDEA
jgi:ATP-binding cassette subfamily C protein LapB